MPYTPPSHRSPASTASSSPDVSRRSSFQSAPRPSLPRSSSYLNKHRRTPSVNAVGDKSETLTAPDFGEARRAMLDFGGSVRQSPPPGVDERALIPNGAVISPPESATSGSDEDEPPEMKSRQTEVLKNLREAVSQISKSTTTPPPQNAQPKVTIPPSFHMSLSTSALSNMSRAGRKNGHVRSSTEPHVPSLHKSNSSSTNSEEETDEDSKCKPQMVRKKSGELVRPALRGHRRPSSVPGTPVFSKAVHFDSHLEHVRHFLQVDRPLAVSAGSSPVDNYESDSEYPFPGRGRSGKGPPFEWELATPNFPHDSLVRSSMPARLERVWLSNDQKALLGSVAVVNLAFHKLVVCRFTFDYWKTVSEVNAEYGHEIRPRESPFGHDRFTFNIKLSDLADLESKTLFFCVRYLVNGQEHWDNNDATNFQVGFKKKYLPQNGKNNFQGSASKPVGGLPRSSRRQNSGDQPAGPAAGSASADAFGKEASLFNFGQPIHEYLGEPESGGGLRFKSKSSSNLATDNLAKELSLPSGVAFSNRYDFSASLDAAVKAAKDAPPKQLKQKEKDTLYMRRNIRGSDSFGPAPFAAGPSSSKEAQPPATSSLPSTSYEELVNKYCFFGSATKPSSPTVKDGPMKVATPEGRKLQLPPHGVSDCCKAKLPTSAESQGPRRHAGAASHHSLPNGQTKPYLAAFSPSSAASSYATSPGAWSDSMSVGATPAMGGATPPTFASVSGTPASDVMSERFPWTTDVHTATAIQG